jgi:hypothetical protein
MSVGSNQSVFVVEAAKMVAKQFLSVVILGLAVCQVCDFIHFGKSVTEEF